MIADPQKTTVETIDLPEKNDKLFRVIPFGVSIISIATGLLVVTGWLFHIETFKTIFPGFTYMTFNSALCFTILGAVLWLLHTDRAEKKKNLQFCWAGLLSLGVLAIGLLTTYEYISGVHLGIDQLFYRIQEPDRSPYPGRMAEGTALSFMFLSFALFLRCTPFHRWHRYIPALLMIPASVGLLSLIGYLYGDYSLYSPLHSEMALHTAILFVLFSIGVFCLQPHPMFVAIWRQKGAAWLIVQRLMPVALVLILAIGWLILKGVELLYFDSTTQISILTLLFLLTSLPLLYGVAVSLYARDRQAAQYTQTLQENAQNLRLLTDALPVLISYINKDLRYEFVNQSYQGWFGLSKDEIIGHSVEDVLGAEAVNTLHPYFETALSGRTASFETLAPYRTGGERYIKADYLPHMDPKGTVLGFYVLVEDITEEKKAELALKESEQRLRLFVENTPIPVAMLDREMHYLVASKTWIQNYQLSSDIIGKNHYDVFPVMYDHWRQACQKGLAGKVVTCEEDTFSLPIADQQKTETIRWAVHPWYQTSGEIGGIIIYTEFITAQKQAEIALKQSFRELSEIKCAIDASTIVAITDSQGVITYVNNAFCQISKYAKEELIGQTHRIINSGYHPSSFFEDMWRTIGQGKVWKGEVKNKAKDGSYYWVDTTIYPFLDVDGKLYQYIAIHHDITPLKLMEVSLKTTTLQQNVISLLGQKALSGLPIEILMARSCQLICQVLEVEYCKILELQPGGNAFLLVSGHGWEEGYVGQEIVQNDLNSQAGYTLFANEPVIVQNWSDEKRFHAPDILKAHQVQSGISTIIYKKKHEQPYGVLGVHTATQRVFTPEEANFVQSVANIIAISIERKDAEEQILKFTEELEQRVLERTEQLSESNLKLSQEITERRQTEKALRESETRFKAIFNQTFQFIGLLKPDGTLIEANETALQFIDAQLSDVVGKLFWETPWWTHSTEAQQKLKQSVEKAAQGEFIRFEATHKGANSEEIIVDFSLKPVKDETGQVYLLLPEGRDITERKAMENRLLQAKEQADLANQEKGKMLAFVSHDLKNPLNCIIGYSRMLGNRMGGDLTEQQEKYVHNIAASGQHMLDLVMEVLDKARDESGELRLTPEWINIRPFANEIQALLQPQAEDCHVTLHVKVAKDVTGLEADRAHLKQVFLNLLSNAIKYNKPSGKVIMSFDLDEDQHRLVCKVMDTGLGIPPGDLPHLFEEYYRVKQSAAKVEGTGLGLPFVKKLVELHGGSISVTSEEGVGSMFTVILPIRAVIPFQTYHTTISA